jgi:hypothetical protein
VNTNPALAVGTAVLEPRRDRLADVDRERQPLLAAALAADDQLACAPVDVLKSQPGDLSDALPQPRQQQQDREVAAPDRGRPVAAAQQPRDGVRVKRLDQGRQAPLGDRRDGDSELAIDQPLQMQEAQQRPQSGDRDLRRGHAAAPRHSQQVVVDRR